MPGAIVRLSLFTMIREIFHFFRHGPTVQKRQKDLGPVEFQKDLASLADQFSKIPGVPRNAT